MVDVSVGASMTDTIAVSCIKTRWKLLKSSVAETRACAYGFEVARLRLWLPIVTYMYLVAAPRLCYTVGYIVVDEGSM